MNGGGGPHDPPLPPLESDGGEFLLRLLQQQQQQHYHHQQQHQQYQPHQQHQQHQQSLQQQLHRQEQLQQQQQRQQQQQSPFLPHNTVSLDPAVAAVGPTMPISTNHHHHHHHDPHRSQPQNLNLFLQGFPPNSPQTPSFFTAPHQHFDLFRQQQHQQQQQQQHQQQQQQTQFRQEQQSGNHGMFGNLSFSSTSSSTYVEDEALRLQKLGFEFGGLGLGTRNVNGVDLNRRIDPRVNWGHGPPDQRRTGGPPPGFLSKPANQRRDFDGFNNVGREISSSSTELKRGNHVGFGFNGKSHEKDVSFTSVSNGSGVSRLLDHPGLPTGSSLDSGSASASASASDIEHSLLNSDNGLTLDEVDDLSEQLVDSVLAEVQPVEKNDSSTKKKHQRDKDFRSDARGRWILSQKIRNSRRLIECRRDIDWFDAPFLAIYESLIPAEEEKAKQNQLLMLLEKHVRSEWPNAKLYLYGSCANSFGVSKSDIDVCLATDDLNVNKSEILLKLAEILKSDNFQDVQALTRARVPIVKLMDPVTGISCDICINNLLAVVNTKLLRDYAEIDVRLRQLAFLVKHWAKSRGVNETYQGTLSSYAYVLMCIHFLQQRNPPILPCLQSMNTTYAVTVDDVKCTFFDQVERLRDFGSRNNESISKLLWGFFNYWAYCHDYANHVISVRTGCILRKDEKDWTRRIGNDRHLICIEDPFETSHDLGRVVDKRSIRVLREEFERAAEILQREPNPSVALFKPYIP